MVYNVSDCLDCLGTWHCWHIEDRWQSPAVTSVDDDVMARQ